MLLLDAPTGCGKTSAILEWMQRNPDRRYLYISPILSEVEDRIPDALDGLEVEYPVEEYDPITRVSSKSFSLLRLLRERKNISFSHSLFTLLSEQHLRLIRDGRYTLVIDEEVNFIDAYRGRYTPGDITTLLRSGWIEVDEDNWGKVNWLYDGMEDDTQYTGLKAMCDVGQLFCSKNNKEMLVTQLPMSLLSSAQEVVMISYMFDKSVLHAFLKLRGVRFKDFLDVYPDAHLLHTEKEWKKKVRGLISIGELPSTKRVKDEKLSLSYRWHSSSSTAEQRNIVARALRGVVEKHGAENVIYTMPKDAHSPEVDGRRNRRRVYSQWIKDSTFLHARARATNLYSDRDTAVHAYNRYANLQLVSYVSGYGGEVNHNDFAIAELVQWLWRTSIRNMEPVTFYFLSNRMERLFRKWLEE